MSVDPAAQLRGAAAQIVDAVANHGRSLDDALAGLETSVAESDRSALRLICYGSLRHHWSLQARIGELLERPLKPRDRIVNSLLVTALYQLESTRIPDHAVVSASVEATRLLRRPGLAGLVNAVLRRVLREGVPALAPGDEQSRFDHPQWLIDAVRGDWPQDWTAILAANNERAPMWLRVNSVHGTVADYRQRLDAEGIAASALAGIPQGLRLEEPRPVTQLPGFEQGHVSVQDGAAQLAAPWLLEGRQGRVLDACAAPGGKSAHLLEVGVDRIELTCVDSDRERLDAVRGNLDRLGRDAALVHGDATRPADWWDGRPYAAILVDAPCSASGVIRRHPDIKLLRRAGDIGKLARIQDQMLDALWPMLAPGGRLLYVTCSVLASENDAVISRFLADRDDVAENRVLHDNNIRALMRSKTPGFQVLPGTAGLDGFYFACLEKVLR